MEQPDSLWNYSVRTYGKPGVADACLALQERYGLDVNVLLYCCWFGCTRGVVDEPLWDRVLAFSEPWADNVVRPLRAVRTWMKHAGCAQPTVSNEECGALREQIKRTELKAEQLQENTLEELAGNSPLKLLDSASQITCSILNLINYLKRCRVEPDSASRADLACIVTGAISGATLDAVTESINTTFR